MFKTHLHTHVHCSTIHNSQDMEFTYMSNKNEWTGRAQCLTPIIPALREAKVGRSSEVRSLIWPTWRNPISTKNTKVSQGWWYTPVTPATQEDEAGESLESERRRLQWAKITPLHCSLGKSETLFQHKTKSNNYISQIMKMSRPKYRSYISQNLSPAEGNV